MMKTGTVAVMFAALHLAAAGAAQADLSGRWQLDAPAASGEHFSLAAASGTLTLEQRDAAITGTWKGRMPEPWKLTGRVARGAFELETEVRAMPATRNGEPTTVQRRWIFRGTVDGDTMTGSMILAGGEGEPPSQAFSAVRKRDAAR